MTRDVVQRIQEFNCDRPAKLLANKYDTMCQDAFSFLRGTCHLFYQDFQQSPLLYTAAPLVWICGDLHLENFGSYQGKNHKFYYSINDFDEAVLAPCTWDLARFLTSVLVAAPNLKLAKEDALDLSHHFLAVYAETLATGEMGKITHQTATGMVAELLDQMERRDRKSFLEKYMRDEEDGGIRLLQRKDNKILAIRYSKQDKIADLIKDWAKKQDDPKFFQILDVAFRVAGTGSVGLDRYLILVQGKGSPEQNCLLDLKAQPSPSLQPYLSIKQPRWENPAQRVLAVQKQIQVSPPRLLATLELKGKHYTLRELQPAQEKLKLADAKGKTDLLREAIATMAKVTAWSHLGSANWKGAHSTNHLIDFAKELSWQAEILDYAHKYAVQVDQDYQVFYAEMRN